MLQTETHYVIVVWREISEAVKSVFFSFIIIKFREQFLFFDHEKRLQPWSESKSRELSRQ